MKRFVIATVVLAWGLGCLVLGSQAQADSATARVRAALESLDHWLATSPQEAPRWHVYLQTERLKTELAKGPKADKKALAKILDQYTSDAPGLKVSYFVKVRHALEQWMAEPSSVDFGQLPAMCQEAKKSFTPLSKAHLEKAKGELAGAVERLDAALETAGEEGSGWKGYLDWPTMQKELAREGCLDPAVLKSLYGRYTSGAEGLEWEPFIEVRRALRDYLILARLVGTEGLQARYETLLDALGEQLKAYGKKPTPELARSIGVAVARLDEARQAPELIAAIRSHFSRPNLFLRASAEVVTAGLGGPFDETSPVVDVILGSRIRGTDRTTGTAKARLAPSEDRAAIDIMFEGTSRSDNVGYSSPVRVYSHTVTEIRAQKRLFLDAERIWSAPAEATAQSDMRIQSIRSDRGARRVEQEAWRRARGQQGQAEMVAARRTEQRATGRMDQETGAMLAQANRDYVERIHAPMERFGLRPEALQFSTTEEALHLSTFQAASSQLGAAAAAPPMTEEAALALCVHESFFNNAGANAFSDQFFTEKRVLEEIAALLGGLPERFAPAEGEEAWALRFAGEGPFTVSFDNNRIRVTLRGTQYVQGKDKHPGMNVTISYKIAPSGSKMQFVLDGTPEIFPPGFVPGGKQRLSARQQVLRTLIERRLGKMLESKLTPDEVLLPGNWRTVGPLSLARCEARDGWLLLAWERAKTKHVASAKGR